MNCYEDVPLKKFSPLIIMELDFLTRRASNAGLLSDVEYSTRANKRFKIRFEDKYVHFGDPNAVTYADYLMEGDPLKEEEAHKKRRAYRARHKEIKLKDGTPAYKAKGQPAFYAWHILW